MAVRLCQISLGNKLVYSSFENGGYNIYYIENLQSISSDLLVMMNIKFLKYLI